MSRSKIITFDKPEVSCGKNRYKSKQEAGAVAREQEIIFASDDLELKVYMCSSCGGWHLTRLSS